MRATFDAYLNRHVLVTGHTGFKGSWLSAWLLKLGAEVTGFSLPADADSHFEALDLADSVNHIEGDLRDADAVARCLAEAKPEIVFHLAAQALVREAHRDPKATFDTNVAGAVNLLEAVRRSESVRVLVFVTSDKCYRNSHWEWGYRETDPLGGSDPYSASKAAAEIVFQSYWESFLRPAGRMRAASARAGNVIGGGDWARDRLIPDCIRAVQSGEPVRIRYPAATRPWQHVLEPLGGYLLLGSRLLNADGGSLCKSWNFGPDQDAHRTVAEVVDDVIQQWGSGRVVVDNDEGAPREDQWLRLNTDRAHHYLDWKPIWRYSDAIRETVAWYKARHDGADAAELTRAQIDRYMTNWEERGDRRS